MASSHPMRLLGWRETTRAAYGRKRQTRKQWTGNELGKETPEVESVQDTEEPGNGRQCQSREPEQPDHGAVQHSPLRGPRRGWRASDRDDPQWRSRRCRCRVRSW